MRLVAAKLAVVLVALAFVGCGGGGQEKGATSSLFVYTNVLRSTLSGDRFWPTEAVVTFDVEAKREVASFEIGDVGEYPDQVIIAGNKIIVNLEQRVVLYDIDGSSPRVLRKAPEGGRIIGIGASPDGTKLALTEERGPLSESGKLRPYAEVTSVAFLDIASGEEFLAVPQSADGFAGFRGQAAEITWRDDGKGVVVGGYTYSGAAGGTATVLLDGSVRNHELGYALVAPNGRRVAYGALATTCGISGLQSEIILRDLDAEVDLASVQGDGLAFAPWEWSSDGKELLYAAYSGRPNTTVPECAGSLEFDTSTERWYVLSIDGSPPEPVDSPEAARARWYGDRRVDFRCFDRVVRFQQCLDEQGNGQPLDIYVGDTKVGSSKDFQIVGFVEE